MSLPGCRQRALDGIERALVAEDPRLGVRFAFFTMLTRHEAIPATERAPDRLPRLLRRAMIIPLIAVSLAALLAASWLIPGREQACTAGSDVAAHSLPSLGRAARCQPVSPDAARKAGT